MRLAFLCVPAAVVALQGCAVQTAAEQTAPSSQTVRLCQGNNCSEQPRNVATFQGEPANPEAERRLQALEHLAAQNPKAAYDLGLRLLRGDGVERNSYQALQWMRKAGDGGLLEAQLALGKLYLAGFEEMGSDPQEAEAWLTRAAGKGSKEAQKLLPEAQKAKANEQSAYQVRDYYRKYWGGWIYSAAYYWAWSPTGWYLR